MRILIASARLEIRAGSELATLEFAEAHRRNGHQVAIFTLVRGELSTEYSEQSGVPVFDSTNRAALIEFAPQLIHAHHWPTVVTLEWLGVVAPWVIGFLGIHPPLENPPPLLPGHQVPWWTINEITEANVCDIPGWRSSPHLVVGNWFDDQDFVLAPVRAPVAIRRLLVVSNHFPEATREILERVATELGISITWIGIPGQQAVVDGELLQQFDCVVTLGRTAILALAMGTPVLVVDHFGADGWVTPDTVETMALHNFSGRWKALEPTSDLMRGWLMRPPSMTDLQQLQEWATTQARFSTVTGRLDVVYADPCTEKPSQVFGTGSLAVGELLNQVELIRLHERHLLLEERDQAIRAFGQVSAERDAIAAERDSIAASVNVEADTKPRRVLPCLWRRLGKWGSQFRRRSHV